MRRLRWLTIVLPVLFVGGMELLSDTFLDPYLPFPVDTILVVLVVLATAAVFSSLAFTQIDRLDAALRARNETLEARDASARALRQVSIAMTAIADLDDILRATVDNARSLLGGDLALISLAGGDGSVHLRATSGPADAFDPSGAVASAAGSASTDPTDARRFIHDRSGATYLTAPLTRAEETVGTLAVLRASDRPASEDDLETLGSLARQASIAIETDRLQVELRELAVLAERERIAGELHDGLAQVLGYVNAKSQAVDELLAAGRSAEARAQLGELAAAARSLYVDVREAILGLRGPVAADGGLVTALRAWARRFAEASKLAVQVEASDAIARIELDPVVEDEVFGIVREGLTNVRKHAAARRVTVRLDRVDDALVVEIADDGRGLALSDEPTHDAWPHLGQATMRERAARVGGRVEWRSRESGGTVVHLAIPLEPRGPTTIPEPEGAAGPGR